MKNGITKIVFILIICIGANLFFTSVRAEEVTEITTLEEFSTYVTNGGKIKLGADITVTANMFVKQPLEIDLNGHTINVANKTLVVYSDLTVKDTSSDESGKITGSVSNGFKVQIGSSSGTSGSVTLESGTIEATAGYGIRILDGNLIVNGGTITGKSFVIYNQSNFVMNGGRVTASTGVTVQVLQDATFTLNGGTVENTTNSVGVNLSKPGSKFTMNGGKIEALSENGNKGVGITAYKDSEVIINDGQVSAASFALSGNGSDSGNSDGTNAKFTINGGALTSTSANAIYAPQVEGITTITGGTLTGYNSAIEIRAGELIISGGIFNGNQEVYSTSRNENGSSTIGAAVAVVQHTTKQPINVVITGGTFNANIPFSESNGLENSEEDVQKISYDISGGVFNATGDKTVDVEDYQEGFIWGGKYTHWVEEYLKDGYGEKPENKMIAVYKWRNVAVIQSEYGYTTITRKKTISDDGEEIVTVDDETSDTMVRALYKDEIYITITPDEGYVISATEGRIVDGGSIIIKNNGFESPDADSEVSVDFEIEPINNDSDNDTDDDTTTTEQDNNQSDTQEKQQSKKEERASAPTTGDEIIIYASLLVIAIGCFKIARKSRK